MKASVVGDERQGAVQVAKWVVSETGQIEEHGLCGVFPTLKSRSMGS